MKTGTGWQQFLQLCVDCKDSAELQELFELLLTDDEREQLATRVLLVKALLQGEKPQRQIAQELELSIAKVTRGSNALKKISSRLKDFLLQ